MPSKYLPLGSIVKLKNSDKKLMIIGYYSLEYNNSVKIYDYEGCSYPEGMLLKNNSYSFNHSDIASVVFLGYLDTAYNKLNANLLDQLNEKTEDLEKPSSFVNLKFDKNGVVVYDEISPVKKDAEVVDELYENPFSKENIKQNKSEIPLVDIKLDSLSSVKDDKALKDTKEIESKFKFTFDANGVVTGEVPTEEKVAEEPAKANPELIYEFDENGDVTGIKGEEKEKVETPRTVYSFDSEGRVISEGDKKAEVTEEFEIPHYKFDENGIIIN